MKNILFILIAMVVLGGLYFIGTANKDAEPVENTANPTNMGGIERADLSPDSASPMLAEENAVVVTEQRPGNTVKVAKVHLAAAGYVVIYEDTDGETGAILGSSAFLPAGENSKVVITLNRPTKDGETLWSVLHFEKNDNTTFEESVDTPVESILGGPISGWFLISADADENIEVTI